jgi:hypothetical protein
LSEVIVTCFENKFKKIFEKGPVVFISAVIIFNEKDQILMEYRADVDCWCFPSYVSTTRPVFIDEAELVLSNLTGLTINESKVVFVAICYGKDLHFVYPNHLEEATVIANAFGVFNIQGNIVEESKRFKYFDFVSIATEMHPAIVRLINGCRIGEWSDDDTVLL